ncbi:sugar ABC transporter ATP-binding protein [Nonomuraea angiospora]|uniref:sugar ABC transporter ATP-binding protein n=1 Tax=Nonomuraea angiospora TaxID=46172 RepID=UPI0029AB0C41|nr:sugar ABC transporter ATP-binding protein [Nonomuraea angiospora]MDX3106047.1 sugar ABC transporter ATP-binding protein [Nonomuraea angiospora]
MTTVLAMRAIGKSFPGVRALDGVSLTVAEGEVVALLGENGAGKSTLMNILAGVFKDYEGEIEIGGEVAHIHSPKDARRHGIAMIHQELNLVPELSVADNIFLGRERALLDRKVTEARTAELLRGLGLDLSPRTLVKQCKIAERQLIEVAKALSQNVRVLVMDEPTSALADAEVRRLYEVIRDLTGRGVAVIYISHRLEELEEIADRVVVLRDGQYIGERTGINRDELIQMMVGRPLGEMFPRAGGGTEGDELLRVEGLCVPGDRDTGRTALRDVSLTVRTGEIVGVAGLMGAGRSELLESIFGVHRPSEGAISLRGAPYRPRSPKQAIERGVALVAEDRKAQSLVLGNSVAFNASLSSLGRYLRFRTVDRRREGAAVEQQVRALRVKTPGLRFTVGNLSGGNQQKVVLAKWLLTAPSLILMDEPTRGIDVGAKAEIHALMSSLAAEGKGVLVASSELPELLAMCDRILVLCEGRITAEFPRGQATQEAILEAAMARQQVTT